MIRVIDDAGHPLIGINVVREWRTSEGHRGHDEAVTDASGAVSFKRQAMNISLFKRITKPLLIFVPAMCGPSSEIYGYSEFRIYWPDGYTLKFDDNNWKKLEEVYQSRDGVCVRDPAVILQYRNQSYVQSSPSPPAELAGIRQDRNESYVEIYFFNKPNAFDYSLTVYREHK